MIARRPGDPFGAAIRCDGDVHAFRCRVIKSPRFNRAIGLADGVPGGSAVLHCVDGVAFWADAATRPEWRTRGVQSALSRRRLRVAAELGADVVRSSAASPSQGHRNSRRLGFPLPCNVAIWSDAR